MKTEGGGCCAEGWSWTPERISFKFTPMKQGPSWNFTLVLPAQPARWFGEPLEGDCTSFPRPPRAVCREPERPASCPSLSKERYLQMHWTGLSHSKWGVFSSFLEEISTVPWPWKGRSICPLAVCGFYPHFMWPSMQGIILLEEGESNTSEPGQLSHPHPPST